MSTMTGLPARLLQGLGLGHVLGHVHDAAFRAVLARGTTNASNLRAQQLSDARYCASQNFAHA